MTPSAVTALIQAASTDAKTEITTVLRMAKVLAARLRNAELENWVDSELNGFRKPVHGELPN